MGRILSGMSGAVVVEGAEGFGEPGFAGLLIVGVIETVQELFVGYGFAEIFPIRLWLDGDRGADIVSIMMDRSFSRNDQVGQIHAERGCRYKSTRHKRDLCRVSLFDDVSVLL